MNSPSLIVDRTVCKYFSIITISIYNIDLQILYPTNLCTIVLIVIVKQLYIIYAECHDQFITVFSTYM